MKPTTLLVFAGILALAAPAFAADEAPPPLPPPPEATDTAPAPTKPATKQPGPAVAKPEGDLPTMEQIQALYDAANYNDALKGLTRVLPLKGKAAEPYDRQKLLNLKFEIHMRQKQQSPAIATLNEAAEATDDEAIKGNAKATVQLIKRAKAFIYTPKPPKKTGKPPASLDISDPIARKAAMQAMLDEDMARVVPKVKSAMQESTLPPIAAALEAAAGVRELEIGVTGSDANTKAMVADLGAHGRDLITKTVEKMSKRVDEITRDANETIRVRSNARSLNGQVVPQERVMRRGLKDREPQELRKIIADLPSIAKASQQLVVATGGKKAEADAMVEMCSELAKRAKKTLEADYSQF